jgi:hypothetical protein
LNNKTFPNNTFSISQVEQYNYHHEPQLQEQVEAEALNGTITNVTGQVQLQVLLMRIYTGVTSIYSNTLNNITSTGTGGTVVGILFISKCKHLLQPSELLLLQGLPAL